MMRDIWDDPKLTAYALGELGELSAAELAEFETRLAGDEAARAEIDAIRAMATRLGSDLAAEAAAEPGPALADVQRAAVVAGEAGMAAAADSNAGVASPRSPVKQRKSDSSIGWNDDAWWDALVGLFGRIPARTRMYAVLGTVLVLVGWYSAWFARYSGVPENVYYWAMKATNPSSFEDTKDQNSAFGDEPPIRLFPWQDSRSAAERRDASNGPVALQSDDTSGASGSAATNQRAAPGGAAADGDASKMAAPGEPAAQATALWPMVNATRQPFAPTTGGGGGETDHALDQRSNSLNSLNARPDQVQPETLPPGDHRGLRPIERYPYPMPTPPSIPESNSESYAPITDNPFLRVTESPLSTFSIDVDTASYANVRRMLRGGQVPPADAVRIEEMVNYFDYDYKGPASGTDPFAAYLEIADCPWQPGHKLARIGIKGREMDADRRPASNLVFLVDVSGSMDEPDKLPLVQRALLMVVNQLRVEDKVAIVVYAGNAGLVLPPTSGRDKDTIRRAIDNLSAGGSTNGGEGIQLAYDLAQQGFVQDGVNRVVLATDGDFNVGITDQGNLVRLIEERAKSGVFLSVLGFGMGNLKDSTMEMLADKGNGNYAYIDTDNEAQKVLVTQLSGTLVTIAKDVKLQVEFNPAQVASYRLIGYENRILAAQDFNNDQKDAGEIGAGHTVTALYELVPVGAPDAVATPGADPLRYQAPAARKQAEGAGGLEGLDRYLGGNLSGSLSRELFTLKIRYKQPDGDVSKLLTFPVTDPGTRLQSASKDFKFASAVAEFGMLLRRSPYLGHATFGSALDLAESGLGADGDGLRHEFMDLVRQAGGIVGGE